ncbi:MAG TPA: methyltransferase domain-containing protein [Methylomirabilota bacterium]
MADRNAAFVGDIPANYDRYLGPVFFHQFADDLTGRLRVTPGMRVLETACGTGIVTRRLLERLRGQGSIVATDLNEAMTEHGRAHVQADPERIAWQPADATKLPFPDGSFDAVVCQFGLMFFPDKAAGVREAFRVLKPGGRYLFNVWDAMALNPIARIAHETAGRFFPADPPTFYTVPFSLHDPAPTRALLAQAGFDQIEVTRLEKTGTSPSAADAATGLIEGNPILGAIMERRPEALADIKRATAAAVAAELGDPPVRIPLYAIVFSARRP